MVKSSDKEAPAKKTRVVKKKVEVAPPVPEPVEVAAAAEPPAAPAAAEEVENTLNEQFNEFMAKLHQVGAQFSSLKSEFKALEKRCTKEVKAAQKASAKKKRRQGTRTPSGFVKPTLISAELAKFLEKPDGTLMARTEVTKQINTYIKANKLQDPKNGRIILPDAVLTKLLKISKGEELTFFNLQKYMSPHFAKATATPATTATTGN
jgi:chromatin remodeling complex protein RSC6